MSDIAIKTSDWNIKGAGINPGDRLILAGPTRAEIEFHDLKGTAEAPITISALSPVVISGKVSGGRVVTFYNCQHVRLTGDPARNGDMNITINNGGQGVDFRDLSSGVEADHLTIDVGYSGLNAKTDPTCDTKTWRGNFTLDGVYFHHNDISTKTGEGIYVGESHYHSTFPLSGCPSGVKSALEHEVKNVTIEDNLIRTSGADGIQVGACPTGAIIRRNNVLKYGTAKAWGQNAGIIINPGTVAQIYENWIDTGTGFAIQMQGPGGSQVHHNVILNAGSTDQGGGIMQVYYMPNGKIDQIYSNTLINTNRAGVEFYNELQFKDNILNVRSGATMYKQGGSAGKITKAGNVELSGNPEQLKLDANYIPTPSSPAYVADYSASDIGARTATKVRPPVITREPGTLEVETVDGITSVYVFTPGGKRYKLGIQTP